MPRIVFHVGCDKTGTTSLQACLCRNRAALARQSVLYPTRNLAFDGLNHTPLVAAYMPDNPDDGFLRVPTARRRAIVESLKRQIDRAAQDTVLVSAEHFSTRFRGDQIEALRGDFAACDSRIVVVVRDHLSRFVSGYATHVASGGRLTIEAFADEVLLPGNIYLRYEEMIAPWQSAFGRERVTCLAYRAEMIADVLAAFGVTAGGIVAGEKRRANVSDGPELIAALRLVNEVLFAQGRAPGSRAWWRGLYVQRAIARRLRAADHGGAAPPWRLDPERLDRLEEIARRDEDWLASEFGLRLRPQAANVVAGAATPPPSAADVASARALVRETENAWSLERVRGSALAALRPVRDEVRAAVDAVRRR